MSASGDFADRVADYLQEISSGHLSVTDEMIEEEADPNEAALLMGLVMLHEQLSFQSDQRRQAEEELASREARYRALFDRAKISIWDCDLSKTQEQLQKLAVGELDALDDARVEQLSTAVVINAVNDETLRLLGAAEGGDLTAEGVFGPRSIPMMREVWRSMGRGETHVEHEGWVHRLDGEPIQVLAGVTLHEDTLAILTLADLSNHAARVEAEERAKDHATELARVNEEVERLFYAVSHDMRAPLRAVQNLANWALEDIEAGAVDEVPKHLSKMDERIQRLDQMMNDLLSYARIGRTTSDVEAIDVGDVLDEVQVMAGLPDGFSLSWGTTPTLRTYRTLLSQVFLNLIGNAVKHHDKRQGRITVSADVTDSTVTFRVIDDGPGIPSRYRQKVFGLFSTLRPRDVVEGSGMGLAFVHKVVTKVGGEITIEGDDQRGTTFKFTWPLDAPASTSLQPKRMSTSSLPAATATATDAS
jgi:signal transduction histidine kinase